jgi:signal transduction histidine kinase
VLREWRPRPADQVNSSARRNGTYRLRRYDGTFRYFAAAGLPIYSKTGIITSWLGVSHDIHAERLAERERHEADKLTAARRLASSIAHAINNPLEEIFNSLYLALRTSDLDPTTRNYSKLAEGEIQRLACLASHLLGFHRQTSAPVIEDLRTTMETAISMHTPQLNAASITIERDYSTSARLLRFYHDLVQAFLGNRRDCERAQWADQTSQLYRSGTAWHRVFHLSTTR